MIPSVKLVGGGRPAYAYLLQIKFVFKTSKNDKGTTASENVFIAEETDVLIVSKFELDKLILASVSS